MNEGYELERVRDSAVIRQLGVRVIIMRGGTFVDLQKSVEAMLGEEANALFYEAGIRAGASSTHVLLKKWGKGGLHEEVGRVLWFKRMWMV